MERVLKLAGQVWGRIFPRIRLTLEFRSDGATGTSPGGVLVISIRNLSRRAIRVLAIRLELEAQQAPRTRLAMIHPLDVPRWLLPDRPMSLEIPWPFDNAQMGTLRVAARIPTGGGIPCRSNPVEIPAAAEPMAGALS